MKPATHWFPEMPLFVADDSMLADVTGWLWSPCGAWRAQIWVFPSYAPGTSKVAHKSPGIVGVTPSSRGQPRIFWTAPVDDRSLHPAVDILSAATLASSGGIEAALAGKAFVKYEIAPNAPRSRGRKRKLPVKTSTIDAGWEALINMYEFHLAALEFPVLLVLEG
jgi:hypothetical protein